MSQTNNIAETLHPLERKVLPVLGSNMLFEDIVKASKLKDVEAMRALQWLSNRKIVNMKEDISEVVNLDENGLKYLKEGLPEKRFLKLIKKTPLTINQIREKQDPGEVNICIGTLKSKAAIDIKGGKVHITPAGEKFLAKESLEEIFLKSDFPINIKSIKDEQKFALDNLKKRKQIVKVEIIKTKTFTLTESGKKLSKADLSGEFIDKLTPAIIKSGKWKNAKLRKYDVKSNVPSVSGGKQHFVNQAIDYIKTIWLEMGFKEMTGPSIQTSLWDLDALFVPQDHPARQMQDTFFIKDPSKGKLSPIYKKVKAAHENGADTGSKGWGGKWSEEIAKENLMITHDTYLSAKVLSNIKKEDLPVKTFQIMKVFRNEALDWKHLFEFYQIGGIVVDPDLNVQHLVGYLKTFFKKMGFLDVRIRPAHFPYVEPGAEVDVLHPVKKQWIELGGSGIFRPEVVKPLLGFDCPVLAWGLGLGRIISEYWDITDIRDLYKNDLKQLREMKFYMK